MEKNTPQIIKEKDFTYFIDIVTGTTVAVMNNPMDYFEKTLWFKFARKTPPVKGIVGLFYPDFNTHFKEPIKGKTKIHPQDTFSVQEGMRIARDRCLKKFYKQSADIFYSIYIQLNCYTEETYKTFLKSDKLFAKYVNKTCFNKGE